MPTRVYRIAPDTLEATVVIEEMERPNGLAFSPDYSLLYCNGLRASHEPGFPHHIKVYDGRRIGEPRERAGVLRSRQSRHTGRASVWTPTVTSGRARAGPAAKKTACTSSPRTARGSGVIHLPEGVFQPLLRRRQTKPSVHDWRTIALRAVRRGPGRALCVIPASGLRGLIRHGNALPGPDALSGTGPWPGFASASSPNRHRFHSAGPVATLIRSPPRHRRSPAPVPSSFGSRPTPGTALHPRCRAVARCSFRHWRFEVGGEIRFVGPERELTLGQHPSLAPGRSRWIPSGPNSRASPRVSPVIPALAAT